MENVAYFTPKAIGYHGKRSIFHTTSDRLPWKTSHISRIGPLKHYKIKRHNRNGVHVVFLEQEAFVQQKNKFVSYFPVPNHSLKNTHKNVRPVFSWSIFHTTSHRLPWKTSHISRLGPLKHYKTQ